MASDLQRFHILTIRKFVVKSQNFHHFVVSGISFVVNVFGGANDAISYGDTRLIVARVERLFFGAMRNEAYFLDFSVNYSGVLERGADVGYQCQEISNHKRCQCHENYSSCFTFENKIVFPEQCACLN
jgi:hypothetical protein